jgi:hypothetical protein
MPNDDSDLELLNENLTRLWSRGNPDSVFVLPDGTGPIVKAPTADEVDEGYYRATHFRIVYALDGDGNWWDRRDQARRAFLRNVSAEVQTTTLLQHVMNGLAHDYVYKSDEAQQASLSERDRVRLRDRLQRVKHDVVQSQASVNSAFKLARGLGLRQMRDSEDDGAEPAGAEAAGPAVERERQPVRHKRATEVIIANNLLVDGQVLRFLPTPSDHERVQEWAQGTRSKSDALTARWEAKSGRLRWLLDPTELHTPTGLTKIIKARAGIKNPMRPVQGTVHWRVLEVGEPGQSLQEIAEATRNGKEAD